VSDNKENIVTEQAAAEAPAAAAPAETEAPSEA
jgi:hypothetical protein